MTTWTSAVWATTEFREELRAFVAPEIGEPTTLEPVSVRPWSTVWRVVSARGVHYAKQNCPGQAHEAALLDVLADLAPERVVPVVAADPARDLLLTQDLGPTLRASGSSADPAAWCRIVAEAAALQRELISHVADLPLRVMLPGDATTYVADAVGRLGALPPDDPRRVPPEVARRLESLLPTIERWSDEVADLDLPVTLNHNDLHDNNVVAPRGSDPLRFFDFGDAMLTEPLGMLLIPLQVYAEALDAGPDDPRLARVADAALEVWSDRCPAAELRAALPAAIQLGRLARAESWRRCVATMTPAERGEYGAAPAQLLGTLLHDPPVGTRPRM